MIDIVMTASLRPEIVEKTLISLRDKMVYADGFRLIVDIAPVGDARYTQKDILDRIRSTVDWSVKHRCLIESMQADALKWTWKEAESEYVLHWEDDWVLRRQVNLSEILDYLNKSPQIGMMCFDRYGKSVLDYPAYRGVFSYLSEQYWGRISGKSLGGPPAILRREYIQSVIPLINGKVCLDLLSKENAAQVLLSNWATLVFAGHDGKGHLVKDIGKKWLSDRGFKMVKNTPRGVTWVEK